MQVIQPFPGMVPFRTDPDGDVNYVEPDIDPVCGTMSVREARFLQHLAGLFQGQWLDIGGHLGWSAVHIAAGGIDIVTSIDPAYCQPAILQRAMSNHERLQMEVQVARYPLESDQFFAINGESFSGISIDGHHTHPHPLRDAQNALKYLRDPGVIFLHDYNLRDVQIAYDWLKDQPGLKSKTFKTMWGIAVCWRGRDDVGSP